MKLEEIERRKKGVRRLFRAGALDQPLILTLGVVKRTWWGFTTLRIIHGVHGSSVKLVYNRPPLNKSSSCLKKCKAPKKNQGN